MQALYQLEICKEKLKSAFDKFRTFFCDGIDDEVLDYVEKLVLGTMSRIGVVDRIIKKKLKNWTIDRITLVDKCILRFSIYEICEIDNIPRVVSINEAIEIAKKFGTSESGRFVNGILDNIEKDDIKNELEFILNRKSMKREKREAEDTSETINVEGE